jgi:hypothetical protein
MYDRQLQKWMRTRFRRPPVEAMEEREDIRLELHGRQRQRYRRVRAERIRREREAPWPPEGEVS